jgi:ferritin-like metal-binding protein YciE
LDEAGVAELLQETLEEEEECDRRLTRLAETVVNVDAETHSR